VLYDKAIEEEPRNVKPHFAKGVALLKLNKLEDALKCFQENANLNPRDAQAHFKKYEVYRLLGNRSIRVWVMGVKESRKKQRRV
jgi:tetratricopeptide (TPR) repeat protein